MNSTDIINTVRVLSDENLAVLAHRLGVDADVFEVLRVCFECFHARYILKTFLESLTRAKTPERQRLSKPHTPPSIEFEREMKRRARLATRRLYFE